MNVGGNGSKARFLAAIIDNILAFVTMSLVVGSIPESYQFLRGIFVVVGYLGYFIILEGFFGRTIGKYINGLVVRKMDGRRGDWKDSLIRGLLRLVEVNPLLFGGIPAGIVIMSTQRNQRIGDLLAGTVVVSDTLNWDCEDSDESPTTN